MFLFKMRIFKNPKCTKLHRFALYFSKKLRRYHPGPSKLGKGKRPLLSAQVHRPTFPGQTIQQQEQRSWPLGTRKRVQKSPVFRLWKSGNPNPGIGDALIPAFRDYEKWTKQFCIIFAQFPAAILGSKAASERTRPQHRLRHHGGHRSTGAIVAKETV